MEYQDGANKVRPKKLYDTLRSIEQKHLNFCAMCYRTETERAVKVSYALPKLLAELDSPDVWIWKVNQKLDLHVCYMCEANLRSALRTIAAIKFGVRCLKVFKVYKTGRLRHVLDQCERDLQSVRSFNQLAWCNIPPINIDGRKPTIFLNASPNVDLRATNNRINLQSNSITQTVSPDENIGVEIKKLRDAINLTIAANKMYNGVKIETETEELDPLEDHPDKTATINQIEEESILPDAPLHKTNTNVNLTQAQLNTTARKTQPTNSIGNDEKFLICVLQNGNIGLCRIVNYNGKDYVPEMKSVLVNGVLTPAEANWGQLSALAGVQIPSQPTINVPQSALNVQTNSSQMSVLPVLQDGRICLKSMPTISSTLLSNALLKPQNNTGIISILQTNQQQNVFQSRKNKVVSDSASLTAKRQKTAQNKDSNQRIVKCGLSIPRVVIPKLTEKEIQNYKSGKIPLSLQNDVKNEPQDNVIEIEDDSPVILNKYPESWEKAPVASSNPDVVNTLKVNNTNSNTHFTNTRLSAPLQNLGILPANIPNYTVPQTVGSTIFVNNTTPFNISRKNVANTAVSKTTNLPNAAAMPSIVNVANSPLTSNTNCVETYTQNKTKMAASVASVHAKKNTDNIDWEDKIPMDVITYVDATDPNAVEIPRKNFEESNDPFGVISSSVGADGVICLD